MTAKNPPHKLRRGFVDRAKLVLLYSHEHLPPSTMAVGRRRCAADGSRTTMPLSLRALLALGVLARPIAAQTAPCFNTLGAINSVMQTELVRIQNGAPPQQSYVYSLCPNTFLDASAEPLEPVLNNVMFVCGESGDRSGRCVILGGSQQVLIQDSLVDGYPLQELSFLGITFSAFETNGGDMTGSSIAAFASSTTTATFIDCVWQVHISRQAKRLCAGCWLSTICSFY